MKFIRGAARLSVRHWQSREPVTSAKTRIVPHKSTSCEQLYPHCTEEDAGPFAMRRAPSTDRMKPQENKPLFNKLLGHSRNKKTGDHEAKVRRSVLNFRRNEAPSSKNVHEKYIPLSQSPPSEHVYSEPRPWSSQFDDCCRPPVYQSVEKNKEENSKAPTNEKKLFSNRLPCYEELTQRLSKEKNKKSNLPFVEGALANKITQNNNKVVIYFGDSIIRKHNEQKLEENRLNNEALQKEKQPIYVNRHLEETVNLAICRNVDKEGGLTEVQLPEAIYSEIKNEDVLEPSEGVTINDATYKKEVCGTMSSDGFLIVEFEENYERARQLVDLVHGSSGVDHHEATVLDEDEHCDWSFIQDWRKR